MCYAEALRRNIVIWRKIKENKDDRPVESTYSSLSHNDSDEELKEIVKISAENNVINFGTDSIISFSTTAENKTTK